MRRALLGIFPCVLRRDCLQMLGYRSENIISLRRGRDGENTVERKPVIPAVAATDAIPGVSGPEIGLSLGCTLFLYWGPRRPDVDCYLPGFQCTPPPRC